MQYYKYINEVIGRDSLMKGRSYNPYYINYEDYYEEPKQFVHMFNVESERSTKIYEVIIKNNADDIFGSTCTCPQYQKSHTCKHIAACLFYYKKYIITKKIKDIYKESKDILNIFYEPSTNLNIKEKLNLELNISFYNNEIEYRLSIGTSKLYVLNNKSKFDNFLSAYFNGGDDKIGTKLTYNKNTHYFEEEDSKLIDYLASFERDAYYSSDIFKLNERDFDFIINNVELTKLKINKESIQAIVEDLPTNFILTQNQNKDYELKLQDTQELEVLTYDFKYVFYKHILYIIPKNYRTLLRELATRNINTLIFKKQDLETFNRGILKNIKEKVEIDEKITDVTINLKPTAKLYFDIASTLTCKVKLQYGQQEIEIFDQNKTIMRDFAYEEEILQDLINSGFQIENNKIKMDDIDSIGNFLDNELSKLNEKYDIYTSKKLNNVNLIKKSSITKDFSIGTSGIMSFHFEIDNINPEELKSIFHSLQSKKSYHRLKNGNIINLESDEELKELNSLVSDLEIDHNNLNGEINIPKYRALYIDSLRTNKYKDIQTNSIFEEFITNFKEYKNIKINLSKEDEEILRDYQKIGVRWLYALYKCDLGGILADEMGLGKSIQTICFLKQVLKEKPNAKILIVCPTSLVYNWQKEFDKFGPNLKYSTLSDNKIKRLETLNNPEINILITSYGILRNDIKEYQEKEFDICIIDEAQYIKNYQSQMTLALKSLNSHTRLALTGTPLENSVTELWSIFDFLMPGYLNSVKKFREKYHVSDIKKEDLERLESLNYQIKPFILRRKKNEVYQDLPDKIENNIYLELPETQKKLYLSVLKETEQEINQLIMESGFKKARFKVLQLLTKLRQICIEPNVLYTNYEGESIKTEKLIEMIKDYTKENHKILIFSSFKRILDLVKTRLTEEHISYYSIDGSISGKERPTLVDKFNNDDTSCFLITLKSGGTGLNLTSADIVIHLDIWWNPAAENQATDRAHRIGQTKKVMVNRLITKGTIEERILELQNKKRILSENLIEGNTNTEMLSSLSEEELKELLTFSQD